MAQGFPRRFGKYHLLKPLAQGGMGALYVAVSGDPGIEKLCAVKTVLPQLADQDYVSRFRDEAQVVVKLQHGNLVQVFDAGEVDGELYLAMEYIDGKDLRAVWNRCARKGIAFPIEVAVHVVKELCRGLAYAHSFGDLNLVHRDVSPPNVLLAFTGEVKLTDFGLASSTLRTGKTAPGLVYGKVSYMSPEQARGETLDGRTDLYSAGILLWELLTGRQLFPQGTEQQADVLQRVRAPEIEPPSRRASRVPKALDKIVLMALAPNPADRYPNGEAMRQALAEYLAAVAPATDAALVASFLKELFGEEIEREREDRKKLLELVHLTPPRPTHVLPDAPERETPVRPEDLIGTLIADRYRILSLVGEGGMGRVYAAEHVEIGKRLAIKVLHPGYSRSPEVIERFRREARAASKIGHPNIVDVTDSGSTADGCVYFVMEFLEGIDLHKVIAQQGALEVDRALSIASQICRAASAAHKVGIIHRDLKPENIFLVHRSGNPDFVKVLDFGIAKSAELEEARAARLTHPGITMGTPEYMAPEQAAGKQLDERVDVYAIGAILYEMLCAVPPYEGANFMEILNKKATQPPMALRRLRPDLPEAIEAVVMRALASNPADRPASAEALDYELTKALSGRGEAIGKMLGLPSRPGGAPGTASSDLTWRVEQRPRRYGWPLAAAAVVGAGAIAAIVLWPRHRSAPPAPPPTATVEIVPAPAALPPERAIAAVQPVADVPPPPKAELPTSKANGASAAVEPRTSARNNDRMAQRRQLAEARRHLASGRYSQAKREFTELLQGGERTSALLGLGEVAWQQGDYVKAAMFAKRAIADGAGVAGHVLLANTYLRLKKFDDAAREYKYVLQMQANHPDATRGLQLAQKRQAPR